MMKLFVHSHKNAVATGVNSLQTRYPGVHFKGEFTKGCKIATTVKIEPGATIFLSSKLQITGTTRIEGNAHIEAGVIEDSTIGGKVTGGKIIRSGVPYGAVVTGGVLDGCTLHPGITVKAGNHVCKQIEPNVDVFCLGPCSAVPISSPVSGRSNPLPPGCYVSPVPYNPKDRSQDNIGSELAWAALADKYRISPQFDGLPEPKSQTRFPGLPRWLSRKD